MLLKRPGLHHIGPCDRSCEPLFSGDQLHSVLLQLQYILTGDHMHQLLIIAVFHTLSSINRQIRYLIFSSFSYPSRNILFRQLKKNLEEISHRHFISSRFFCFLILSQLSLIRQLIQLCIQLHSDSFCLWFAYLCCIILFSGRFFDMLFHKIPSKQSQAYKCDHCKNSSDPKYHVHLITFAAHQTGDRRRRGAHKTCHMDLYGVDPAF